MPYLEIKDSFHDPSLEPFSHINNLTDSSPKKTARIGIIGGGTAGSTIAIRLAALGIETYLFERKASLIDGPPMCHLHAGGNLYREIPDEDCVELLKQCIEMVRLYPHSIDIRPTVIAVPTRDTGNPKDLLPRLELLKETYKQIVAANPNDEVLGDPDDYYHLYERKDLMRLAKLSQVAQPSTTDEWMIAAAKHLDLDKLKYPVVAVQEYGWNIFRLSASAQMALDDCNNAHTMTDTQVVSVVPIYNDSQDDDKDPIVDQWEITYSNDVNNDVGNIDDANREVKTNSQHHTIIVDYLVNACGFRTGTIDDMVGIDADRMVEFKASYITHWDDDKSGGQLPEIIIHGTRGTSHGMAQLTPYPDGHYQIHGMTKDITLFENGLVNTPQNSAQPLLKAEHLQYIQQGWSPDVLHRRSQRAIDFVSEFVPAFASALPTENALYGAQQIPGNDDTLRVADVSLYRNKRYARAENVKASSTLLAADEIVTELQALGIVDIDDHKQKIRSQHQWPYLNHTNETIIDKKATDLAQCRKFPEPMATVNNAVKL